MAAIRSTFKGLEAGAGDVDSSERDFNCSFMSSEFKQILLLPSITFRMPISESSNPDVSAGSCWDEFHFPDDGTWGEYSSTSPLVRDQIDS